MKKSELKQLIREVISESNSKINVRDIHEKLTMLAKALSSTKSIEDLLTLDGVEKVGGKIYLKLIDPSQSTKNYDFREPGTGN